MNYFISNFLRDHKDHEIYFKNFKSHISFCIRTILFCVSYTRKNDLEVTLVGGKLKTTAQLIRINLYKKND